MKNLAILLLLGLASKEDYTQALKLQQNSAIQVNQQQQNKISSQQRKVARPATISFDLLSANGDINGADDPAAAKVAKKATEMAQALDNMGDSTNSLNQVDQKQNLEEQVDQTEESKLADQIRNQAKAIADEQSKQQQKDQASGKLKISSAAAALNNAEMGIESGAEESEANKNEIVSISSDQLYVGDKNPKKDGSGDDEPVAADPKIDPASSDEAAAITMAKQAAKNAVEGKNKTSVNKKDGELSKKTNLELEQSSDLENSQRIAELENSSSEMADAGLSRQNALVEDKSQVIEEVSDRKDDLAVPNWPKYSDPLSQRAEIDKELKQVKKQYEDFKKNSDEAETLLKQSGQSKGKSEFEQKQKEIELQHKQTVNKIKSEIWSDRLSFLQKMIQLAEEGKQDESNNQNVLPSSTKSFGSSEVPTVKALAQQSTKGKTQADAVGHSKSKSKAAPAKDTKNKTIGKKKPLTKSSNVQQSKKDLLNRIDSQLARLKGKNKDSEGLDDEDTTGETEELSEDHKSLEDRTKKLHMEHLNDVLDEYGGSRMSRYGDYDIHDGRTSRRGNLDLYDIFKDFDRDGDGIVDDIDLDDPHWTENCRKRNWDPLEYYDDSALRAGRYRGMTEEEWSQREAQHQQNLEELQKKQKELEDAHTEVHEALTSLSTEKDNIDKEIKEKVLETEKMRVEFRKKAAERAQAEREAQREREKAIMAERVEQRKAKQAQIRETEQIENKAIQLHGKAKELQRQKLLVKDARQEVAEEIRKLKSNIKFAQRAKKAAEKIKERIAEKREWIKKHRESELELQKQQREAAMKEEELERERHQQLLDSCPHAKVRSYQCNSDGLRLVKIYRWHYDFDANRCIPRVLKKTVSCRSENPYDIDGDGYDDVTGQPTEGRGSDYSRWKYHVPRVGEDIDDEGYGGGDLYADDVYGDDYHWGAYHGGYMHADDFHTKKAKQTHFNNKLNQPKDKDLGEALSAEEEEDLKNLPDMPDKQNQKVLKKATKPTTHPQTKLQEPQAPKAAPIEEDVSADSADQFDTNSKKQGIVQQGNKKQVKKLKEKAKKEKTQADSNDNDNIETQSKQQIDLLNQHLGAIEGKVSEITKKYEELKQADEKKDEKIKKLSESRVQVSAENKGKEETKLDLKSADKSKIQKFAKMLKTLNKYKAEYKKATSQSEKKKIHSEVMSFTQKWLDAKNLLLQSQLEFKPPSDS